MNENPIPTDDRLPTNRIMAGVSEPATDRRRTTSILMITLLILALFLSDSLDHANAGTGSDSSAVAAIDSVENDRPADTAVRRNDAEHVSGPIPAETVGLTVGERLKNLDSLMTLLPADSLPHLMMEYERILDSAVMAQSSPSVRTTRPTSSSDQIATQSNGNEPTSLTVTTSSFAPLPTSSIESNTPKSTDAEEFSNTTTPSQPLGYIRSQPRSSISTPTNNTLVQSDYLNADSSKNRQFDPSDYRGIRKSEIERYERKSADRPAKKTARPKRTTAAKRSTPARHHARKRAGAPRRTERHYGSFETPSTTFRKRHQSPVTVKSSEYDRAFTDGLALVRAGRYAEAVKPLSVAVKGSRSYRTTATYYLALSYANAGDVSSATPMLKSLKSGSGPLADKAWIAYARLLAKSGDRDMGRTELVRFLRARPSSTLSAEGRAALQQI